jgi:hypothetical protein
LDAVIACPEYSACAQISPLWLTRINPAACAFVFAQIGGLGLLGRIRANAGGSRCQRAQRPVETDNQIINVHGWRLSKKTDARPGVRMITLNAVIGFGMDQKLCCTPKPTDGLAAGRPRSTQRTRP